MNKRRRSSTSRQSVSWPPGERTWTAKSSWPSTFLSAFPKARDSAAATKRRAVAWEKEEVLFSCHPVVTCLLPKTTLRQGIWWRNARSKSRMRMGSVRKPGASCLRSARWTTSYRPSQSIRTGCKRCIPRFCFLNWSGRLLRGKKSATGQIERLKLVREKFPDVERVILEDPSSIDKVDLTDALDAYAALWTALRWEKDKHETLTLVDEILDGLRAGMIV